MAGGTAHSAQLSALTLHAGETRTLNIPEMLTSAGLKNFSGSTSLVFDVQGNPAGLLLAGGSVDQKYTYVFGVVPKASRSVLRRIFPIGAQYPQFLPRPSLVMSQTQPLRLGRGLLRQDDIIAIRYG